MQTTVDCAQCGAPNLGTKFCEACGAPTAIAAAEPEAVPTPSPQLGHQIAPQVAPQIPPRPTVGATPVRAWALIFFLLANTVPGLVSLAAYSAGANLPVLARGLAIAFAALAGLFSLIGALAGRAGDAGKTFGALFALLYAGVAIFLIFGGLRDLNGYTNALLLGVTYLAIYLSWALGRPFHGKGYFGLLLLFALAVIGSLIDLIPGIYNNYLSYIAIQDVVFAASLWIVVGLSVVFEGRPVAVQSNLAPPRPLPTSAFNFQARFAFVCAMTLLGIELLSLLALVPGLGLLGVMSLLAPVLIILAIVFGHLGRSQIRRTRQFGAGQALAALIIGYSFIALTVAGIAIQMISIAMISTRLFNGS